jgi:maleate isomerase
MTRGGYDYGRAGRIGIGTPQANPTVESEFAILLPPAVSLTVTRLTSAASAPADRLHDYLLNLADHLAAYDSFWPDAFGFACTASSYLIDAAQERAVIDACQDRFGYPVVTAADAIDGALKRLDARRIVLISPYPAPLAEAATRYWRGRGYDLVAVAAAGDLAPDADTRGIYALGSDAAAAALARIDLAGADAVLLSGTGMPSLPLIANVQLGLPVLSSNLCLAAALCARIGTGDLLDPASPATHAWHARCAAATDLERTIPWI